MPSLTPVESAHRYFQFGRPQVQGVHEIYNIRSAAEPDLEFQNAVHDYVELLEKALTEALLNIGSYSGSHPNTVPSTPLLVGEFAFSVFTSLSIPEDVAVRDFEAIYESDRRTS